MHLRRAKLALGLTLALGATLPAHAGLIGFYTFDGNANDSSGHGNHGVLSATAPILTAPGGGYTGWNNPNSQAYQFGTGSSNPADPLNSFITLPIDINPSALPQVTFGGWVKSADLSYVTRGIISHDNGGYDRTFDSRTFIDGQVHFCALTGSAPDGGICGGAVTTEWTFFALRYDAANGTGQMMLNNVISVPYAAISGSGLATTTVGRNPSYDLPFVGLIDNVFIYDTYLSNAEMRDLYNYGPYGAPSPTPEPSTLALFGGGALVLAARRRLR